jgi:hypothetical protein
MWRIVLVLLVFVTSLIFNNAWGSDKNAPHPPAYVIEDYLRGPDVIPVDPADKASEILFEAVDVNGDGIDDWIVYQFGYCGSQGCSGDLYISKKGTYCYSMSGWVHQLKNRNDRLRCQRR